MERGARECRRGNGFSDGLRGFVITASVVASGSAGPPQPRGFHGARGGPALRDRRYKFCGDVLGENKANVRERKGCFFNKRSQ